MYIGKYKGEQLLIKEYNIYFPDWRIKGWSRV